MMFKKSGSHVFGVNLNNAERKALNEEIRKSYSEFDHRHNLEYDAMVLWVLHEVFGFGPERLRRFYDAFIPSFDGLLQRYDMDVGDGLWLCTKQLKDYGIDIEQWEKERMNVVEKR